MGKRASTVFASENHEPANILPGDGRTEPFLGLRLDLDPHLIAQLIPKVSPFGLTRVSDARAVYLNQANPQILDAAIRLIKLIPHPGDAELLAPLVVEEILIRLLRGPDGMRAAQIGLADSGVHGVT